MHKSYLRLFAFSGLICLSPVAFGQLAVWSEPSDSNFIFALSGPGIVVENPTRNCAPDASGFFDASAAMLDLSSGAMLSSGLIWDAPGPNNYGGTSTAHGWPGDADLDAMPSSIAPSYDACIIEFDMRVSSDTLKLDYIFGSEEYLEFAGSSFNDVFAFFLSGPGITGTVNIALVPGSTEPVSINTINSMMNPSLYVDNGDGFSGPSSTDSTYVEFDGLTVRLQATHPVMPDSTYHMKLVVADVGDGIFDSGVFLATGALGSLRLGESFIADGDGSAVREGCGVGTLTFSRDPITADTLWLDLGYEGSADASDFYELPARVAILPGESDGAVVLEGIEDEVAEGLEILTIHLYNPQSGYIYRTLDIPVADGERVDFTYTNATPLAADFSAYDAPAGSIISWTFGDGSSAEGTFVNHVYANAGTYEVCMVALGLEGCEWTSCKMVDIGTNTGLDLYRANTLSLFPNPASTQVVLNLDLTVAAPLVQVYDLTGRLVLQENLTSNVLSVTSLVPGVYTVVSGNSRGRLVVE
ncbi:MAG: T9SS type A sorting domain-containing protein [Bacteroidetes bacterium]|nr:T9SS type A sorting domain-containing protein [Bacteroidota bacterium]